MTRVGYFQFDPQFGKVDKNLETVLGALNKVDVDIMVLPELAFSGYYFTNRDELESLAENPKSSQTIDALVGLCKERDFYIVTGFAEKSEERVFNSALLLGPKGIVTTYRKTHLFNTEKKVFDKGDTGFVVSTVRGVSIGMMICFDWVFPEAARTLALKGADIICHPSNLVLAYCQRAMLTRCIENLIFAVTANRYGTEKRPQGTLSFSGQSQVVAPRGKLFHRSAKDEEECFVCEIDIAQARDKKITPNNHLFFDRRSEFYELS